MKVLLNSLAFLLILFQLFDSSNTYKILGLFPHHGKSHFDMFEPILKGLAAKGHEVTVISHYPLLRPLSNYKDISLRGSVEILNEFKPVDVELSKLTAWIVNPMVLRQFANNTCESGYGVKTVQEFIKSDQHFDVILAEAFNSDCFLGFVHKFKAPLVALSSSTFMPWTSDRIGQPDNPSYIPHNLLRFSDRMSFLERVENAIMLVSHKAYYRFFYEPNDQRIARNYFGYKLPPLRDIAYNTSLLLVNTHFSLNLPRPNVPGVIEIGGIHIGKHKKLSSVSSNILSNDRL